MKSAKFKRRPDTIRQDAYEAIRGILANSGSLTNIPERMPIVFRGESGAVGRRDAATHLIHWYPAKMFHRIPQEILRALANRKAKTILDPFCGSGTVLLEGALRGHRAIGVDINPFARLIARVKTTPISPANLSRSAETLLRRIQIQGVKAQRDEFLDFWFKPEVIEALYAIRLAIDDVRNPLYREFFLVAFASIIRRCSWADPSIPPPVKLTQDRVAVTNRRYWNDLAKAQELSAAEVFNQFRTALEKNIRRMSELFRLKLPGSASVAETTAHAADTQLPQASVDLILTSPPYCGAQKYVRSFRLEMTWLGMSRQQITEIDRRTLGTERISLVDKVDSLLTRETAKDNLIRNVWKKNRTRAVMISNYLQYLDKFVEECREVLKPGGNMFVTFGTSHIAGIKVDMSSYFRRTCERSGLRFVTTLIDVIPSRGLLTDRHKTSGTIDDEAVVWLQK